MSLPFSGEAFFEVMRSYNEGVWPAQFALYAVGIAAVLLLAAGLSRALSALLALLWLWMALAYHYAYFSAVNPAAGAFAAAFVLGAALFAWQGVARGRLQFRIMYDSRAALGAALVAFALAGYPLLALAVGHRYPQTPTFGMPCPTTLFTIGLLAFARPARLSVFVVPFAWTLIGAQAAFLFGVFEDLALLVAAGAAAWFALAARQARPA